VLAPLHYPPEDFKLLLADPLFLVKVRSCNRICAFISMDASLAENTRIDEQLANAREGLYTFRVQGITRHRVGIFLPVESSTQSSAHLYVFDSDVEAQVRVNM
jgi:hypothetical protein